MDPMQLDNLDPRFRELILQFASDLPHRAGAIREAHNASQQEEFHRLTHQLKGAAGGYGFPRISALAAGLEAATRENPTLEEQILAQIEEACREAGEIARSEQAGAMS